MSKRIGKNKKKKVEEKPVIRSSRRQPGRSNMKMYILVALLILAMLGYLILPILNRTPVNNSPASSPPPSSSNASPDRSSSTPGVSAEHNIVFEKEGELRFIKSGSGTEIKKVDIEVSESESERDQGLMYRQNMQDGQAMLFVFKREAPQAFWMKNTYIPLDIIYVNAKKEIVSIAENAQPLNTQSLPSKGSAQYVVEVPGGFSRAYGLEADDIIEFDINTNSK